MFQDVALARAEPATEQQPSWPSADLADSVDQGGEPVLDVGLTAAQRGYRVPARHPRPQGLDRAPGD